jgi:hypothetical protein
MNWRNFTFKYDYAIGFFDKYLFSEDSGKSPKERVLSGFSNTASVCTSSRYSLIPDFGSFSNMIVKTHLITLELFSAS